MRELWICVGLFEVKIEKFSKEGHGIGTYTNDQGHSSLIEVPFTIPGDIVHASLRRRNKGITPYKGAPTNGRSAASAEIAANSARTSFS